MKYIVIVLLALSPNLLSAQFEWGVGGGIHSIDIKAKDIFYKDNFQDSMVLKFLSAGIGYHFGVFFRFKFNDLYVQPELYFNSIRSTYSLQRLKGLAILDSIKSERYNNIGIPLMLGLKLGVLRLNGGPVCHLFVSSSSDLTKISGYSESLTTAKFGYQVGLGLDINLISLDIRHEGNLYKYGDHIEFFGTKFNFDSRPSRLIGTLSLRF